MKLTQILVALIKRWYTYWELTVKRQALIKRQSSVNECYQYLWGWSILHVNVDWESELYVVLMSASTGHYYMYDVWPYVRIYDRIRFAGSDWVKWVKVLRRFVGVIRVGLELGFEGVNWVNEPVLLGGAIPNFTGDLSRAVGAVKSLTIRSSSK